MTTAIDPARELSELAERVADTVRHSRSTVAAAESVTGGQITCQLSAANGASEWFRGGLVAYSEYAKFSVLGVQPGPFSSRTCAHQMAHGIRELLSADFAVSTTGAGGPGAEEGQPAGTVSIALESPAGCQARHYHFDGDPETIVHHAALQALRDLATLTSKTLDEKLGHQNLLPVARTHRAVSGPKPSAAPAFSQPVALVEAPPPA